MQKSFSEAFAAAIKNPLSADFHTHTTFCDGEHSVEEMVQSAIQKGLSVLGICTHSPMPFYQSYTIAEDRIAAFQREVNVLKTKYQRQIALFCGLEKDIYSQTPSSGFDYVIGSAHYFYVGGNYYAVDLDPQTFTEGVQKGFGGDYLAAAENYFSALANVVCRTNADIIGHFDLITKFNEKFPQIDTAHPRYVAAWQAAADAILQTGVPIELNTGAISRGWCTSPYPDAEILRYFKQKGAKFVFSSDSHQKETIAYAYDKLKDLLR